MLWRLTNFWGKANFRRSRPGNRFLQLFKNKFKKIFLSTLHHLTLPGERESYREVRLRNWAEFGTSFFKSRTVRLIWKKYSSWVQTDLLSFGQTQPRWCNLTSCQLSHSPPSHIKEKGCSCSLPKPMPLTTWAQVDGFSFFVLNLIFSVLTLKTLSQVRF